MSERAASGAGFSWSGDVTIFYPLQNFVERLVPEADAEADGDDRVEAQGRDLLIQVEDLLMDVLWAVQGVYVSAIALVVTGVAVKLKVERGAGDVLEADIEWDGEVTAAPGKHISPSDGEAWGIFATQKEVSIAVDGIGGIAHVSSVAQREGLTATDV